MLLPMLEAFGTCTSGNKKVAGHCHGSSSTRPRGSITGGSMGPQEYSMNKLFFKMTSI